MDQPVSQSPIEPVNDRDPATCRTHHVENDVCPHRRAQHNKASIWAVWRHGLTVKRDDNGRVACKIEAKNAGIGSIDQTQPDALASLHGKHIGYLAVDGHCVSDTAVVAHVAQITE